jgi:hypothetical protein
MKDDPLTLKPAFRYGHSRFHDYVQPSIGALLPLYYSYFLHWAHFINPLGISIGVVWYLDVLWTLYWRFYKFPKVTNFDQQTITFEYWRGRPSKSWPMTDVTAEYRPRSWTVLTYTTLVFRNSKTEEEVTVDVEAFFSRTGSVNTWDVIRNLEACGVDVTMLATPMGNDPRLTWHPKE